MQLIAKQNQNIVYQHTGATSQVCLETISRTLADFKDENLIEKEGSTIRIINGKFTKG